MIDFRLSNTALNNEFFAKACHEWRERLAEGKALLLGTISVFYITGEGDK